LGKGCGEDDGEGKEEVHLDWIAALKQN